MNDNVKKYKNKLLGGGAGVTALAIIVFFWQMGIGPGDLKALPEIGKRIIAVETRLDGMEATDAALMSEIAESRKAREQLIKEVAALTAYMERSHEIQMVIQQDIKELLRR